MSTKIMLLCILALAAVAVEGLKVPEAKIIKYISDIRGGDDDGERDFRRTGNKGGIQFMITGRMRRVLEDELGYLKGEVDIMEPQIAAVVIERGLARPSSGMPIAWRRQFSQDNPPFFLFKLARGGCRVIASLIGVTGAVGHKLLSKVFLSFGQVTKKTLPIVLAVLALPFMVNVVRSTSDGTENGRPLSDSLASAIRSKDVQQRSLQQSRDIAMSTGRTINEVAKNRGMAEQSASSKNIKNNKNTRGKMENYNNGSAGKGGGIGGFEGFGLKKRKQTAASQTSKAGGLLFQFMKRSQASSSSNRDRAVSESNNNYNNNSNDNDNNNNNNSNTSQGTGSSGINGRPLKMASSASASRAVAKQTNPLSLDRDSTGTGSKSSRSRSNEIDFDTFEDAVGGTNKNSLSIGVGALRQKLGLGFKSRE